MARPQRSFEAPPPSTLLPEPVKRRSSDASIKELLESVPGDHTHEGNPTVTKTKITKMRARHHLVLTLLLDGYSRKQIAAHTGYTEARVTQIVQSPIFQGLYKSILEKRYQAVIDGAHGVVALARAESPGLAKGLVTLAKTARNENTKRQAILDVLALAGHQPVTKTETLSLDKLIEQFTENELSVFARTGKWPRRFAAQMRALGREVELADAGEGNELEPAFSAGVTDVEFEPVEDPPLEDPLED